MGRVINMHNLTFILKKSRYIAGAVHSAYTWTIGLMAWILLLAKKWENNPRFRI